MSKRRQKKEQAKTQQQRMLLTIGGAVIAMVIAGIIIFTTLPSNVELPDDIDTKYENVEQSKTLDGFPQLGDSDAPIIVREYSSFTCPHCKDLSDDVITAQLLPYIERGQVRLIFVPLDRQAENETNMTRAALCASEQGQFFEMHDVMFHWQGLVSYSNSQAIDAAGELGMDTDQFETCLNSNQTDNLIRQARQEFSDQGLTGTPSVFVNREQVDPFSGIIAQVNELLAEEDN